MALAPAPDRVFSITFVAPHAVVSPDLSPLQVFVIFPAFSGAAAVRFGRISVRFGMIFAEPSIP